MTARTDAPTDSRIAARIDGRHLALVMDATVRLRLPLDAGGRHRAIVADDAVAEALLRALETCPGVAVLPAGGGLLGAQTVAANFALALRYTGAFDRDGEQDLEPTLRLCGLSAARIAGLGHRLPMHLERIERWTLGFARYLLRPPELLVIDRAFGGLNRRQAGALIGIEAVYHQRHPFRPALFIDLDSHELPPLPDCRTVTEFKESTETACHS